jgi:Protein of unknown function (DUF992)
MWESTEPDPDAIRLKGRPRPTTALRSRKDALRVADAGRHFALQPAPERLGSLFPRQRRGNPEDDDMNTRIVSLLSAALALGAFSASPAAAQQGAQVGTLSCDVSGGIGMILSQRQTMACLFTPANGGKPEPYLGHIDTFGVALGAVNQGQLIWGVIASSSGIPHGALSGTYSGVGAQATAGAGVGANVLVGGTGNAFSLQPVSVQGQTGLNVAAGVTTITLLPPPPPPSR